MILKRLKVEEVNIAESLEFKEGFLSEVRKIIEDVKLNGYSAVLAYTKKFSEIKDDKIYYSREELKNSFAALEKNKQGLLQRVAKRIENFAQAQKDCLKDLEIKTADSNLGHKIIPVDSVCCYAPGGRYPLPSSVLMTALVAKVAGVKRVVVTSPKASLETLAAAYLAGADCFYNLGGAQAIAAFAYGAGTIESCSMIVGPGNKWVTAAKQLVSAVVGIDLLAGPSELLVIADKSARADWIAADLLAQAEHDSDARAMLISLDEDLIKDVEKELQEQLLTLSTAAVAKQSLLENGFAVVLKSLEEAIELSNKIAPEHLQLMLEDAEIKFAEFTNYGSVFLGNYSAEVFGDYGIGPNHVLPTAGSAKFASGLSVFNFLKARTFICNKDTLNTKGVLTDTAEFAEIENLEGHKKAALIRQT